MEIVNKDTGLKATPSPYSDGFFVKVETKEVFEISTEDGYSMKKMPELEVK